MRRNGQGVGGLAEAGGHDGFLQRDQVGVQAGQPIAQYRAPTGQSPRMPQVFSVATRTCEAGAGSRRWANPGPSRWPDR